MQKTLHSYLPISCICSCRLQKDINIAIDKLTELGCKVEDYPVETGQRGTLWRVRKEYCIQIGDGRGNPRKAYCILIKISDIPKMIRKMKLLILSQIK